MRRRSGSPPNRTKEPPARPDGANLDRDADRRRALALVPVSRETEARLAIYAELLARWQHVKNLVGPSTLDHIWTRHIADSGQLLELAPDAGEWADMGSGAGFPGMVIAIQLHDRPGASVHLIESNGRKCAFLREVARECEAPAIIHNARVEDVLPDLPHAQVLTARAVAPLPRLLEMGKVALDRGALGLFLKSKGEVTTAGAETQGLQWSVLPSKTSPEGRIVRVSALGSSSADRTEAEGILP